MTKSITLNVSIAILLAVALLFFAAAPAFADVNSSIIKIEARNSGHISNYTSSKAETGGNYADGSFGGSGGEGGDVEAEADGSDGEANGNNGGATAGDGGDGGDGFEGGLVETGEATSDAGTFNLLNTLIVKFKVS